MLAFIIYVCVTCACTGTHACTCMLVHMCLCLLSFPRRLDMIVGPQPLNSRAKTFSSPSLPMYYSQGRKNSSQGSECPLTPLCSHNAFSLCTYHTAPPSHLTHIILFCLHTHIVNSPAVHAYLLCRCNTDTCCSGPESEALHGLRISNRVLVINSYQKCCCIILA